MKVPTSSSVHRTLADNLYQASTTKDENAKY